MHRLHAPCHTRQMKACLVQLLYIQWQAMVRCASTCSQTSICAFIVCDSAEKLSMEDIGICEEALNLVCGMIRHLDSFGTLLFSLF